jgi:nucleoside diphosphate kinase
LKILELIGATNPADAAEGTIRKAYATLLEKMQFTVLTVMKMQLSKVLSILQERAVLILNTHFFIQLN